MCISILIAILAGLVSSGPVEDLNPGEWYMVPNSRMDAVAEPGSHIGNISCVMSCWAGGAFDTRRNRLYVTGGGHNGYSGTEIYAFDVDSLKWFRLDNSVPIGTGPGGECPADPDATPCATHTYDGVDYLPTPVDRFIEVSFPLQMVAWLYDPATTTWYKKTQYPCDDPGFYWDANPTGALSAYDPGTGLYWWRSSYMGDLAYYNPVTDKWRCYGKGRWVHYYFNMAVDSKRKKLIAVGGGDTVLAWDISDTSKTAMDCQIFPTTGATGITAAASPGLEYDPAADKLVAWGSGADVYTLDLDTRVWTRIAPAATNAVIPTAPNQWGTWGRFRYVPSKNVYVLVNNTNENVYIYRLNTTALRPEIRAVAETPRLRAMPNPFTRTTRIYSSAPLEIYDIRGNRVAKLPANALWDASGKPAGVYMARLTTAQGGRCDYRLIHLK